MHIIFYYVLLIVLFINLCVLALQTFKKKKYSGELYIVYAEDGKAELYLNLESDILNDKSEIAEFRIVRKNA